MEEPPPSLSPPPPPPPPTGKVKVKVRVAKVWVPKSSNRDPESSIPIPIPAPTPAPVTGYRPYGAGASSFRVVPYGYGYQYFRPPQPQPQPQVDMNASEENRGKVDVVQSHTTLFGLIRHGTGVFHPPRVYNNRPSLSNYNRGWRNKQGAAATHQFRRSRNASKGNNDGSVKQEECHEHSPPEIGLPQDWTY